MREERGEFAFGDLGPGSERIVILFLDFTQDIRAAQPRQADLLLE